METNFNFELFLQLHPTESKLRGEWYNKVYSKATSLKTVVNYKTEGYVPVVYLPMTIPEFSLMDVKWKITSMIQLVVVHIEVDWQKMPASDESGSNIAVVMAPKRHKEAVKRATTESLFKLKTLEIRGIAEDEIHSPFSFQFFARHHKDQTNREALVLENIPSWANFNTIMTPGLPGQRRLNSLSEALCAITSREGLRVFQHVLPGATPTSQVLIPIRDEFTQPDVYKQIEELASSTLGVSREELIIRKCVPDVIPSPVPPPTPTTISVPNQTPMITPAKPRGWGDESEEEASIEQELEEPQDATNLKTPEEEREKADTEEQSGEGENEKISRAEKKLDELAKAVQRIQEQLAGNTMSLTSIQSDIVEIKPHDPNSISSISSLPPEWKSGMQEVVRDTLIDTDIPLPAKWKEEIKTAMEETVEKNMKNSVADGINDAFQARRAEDEMDKVKERDLLLDTIIAAMQNVVNPELEIMVFKAMRESCGSMVKLIRHPDNTRADEIADAVERMLTPTMQSMVQAIHRLSVMAELHSNAPNASALGSANSGKPSCYQLLNEINKAVLIQANELAQAKAWVEKFMMSMLHALDRDMRNEAEHEVRVRSHLKTISTLGKTLMEAQDLIEKGDFTTAFNQVTKFLKSNADLNAEFEAYFVVPFEKKDDTQEQESSAAATYKTPSRHV